MLEKRLAAVSPQAFIINGGADGSITVSDTSLFRVKQEIVLSASSLPNLDQIEIKRIVSKNLMYVGPKGGNIDSRIDVSAYTIALSAVIFANEQKRPSIPFEEYTRAVYEEEPTVAVRSLMVDKQGNSYEVDNPLPVQLSDGSINIGTVNAELETQLSHKDNFPNLGDIADSVRIGGGVYEMSVDSDNNAHVEVHGNAPNGLDKTLKLSETGATVIDGLYSSVNNTKPSNIGLIASQRSLAPADTDQLKRITAVTSSTVSAMDVSLHDENGEPYTTLNPLPINSIQILEKLQVPLDFFGNQAVATRTNQIEVPLDDSNWTSYIDSINASTGSASQSNGQVTLTTGTNANGRYAIISKDFVKYRPNSEIGWGFTWSFPTPSIAGVTIRIGATDDATTWNNSVYFSHEGGIFSLVHRRGGATIFSAERSAWLDKCDGTSSSSYVDFNDLPVQLDITKDQLARIRAGLFGHAGFVVELLAPNQTWVKIYEYGGINTLSAPVFSNFDLKIAAEVKKVSAGSGVYTLSSACWAGWTGSILQRMDSPLSDRTLTQVTRTVIEGKSSSGGGTYIPVKVNPSGSLLTETTLAGSLVSAVNSTSALLGANAAFLGTSEDVLQYGVINIAVRSNVDSAIDGLQFLFSADNVNFYSSDEYTILAGKFKTYSIAPVARYFKIQYTNGAAAQAQFLLQTVYRQVYVKPSSHRLQDALSPQDDAEVVQSIMVAKLPNGNFENIKTTVEGNLITDFAQNQKDAFDRLITVSPTHLKSFDYRIDKHPESFDEIIVGSATSIHNINASRIEMNTTTAANDSVIRQTYQSFEYTRGNTQQGLFSLNLGGGPKTNNIRYFGLGDSQNGAFIGIDGNGFFVLRRSSVTGVVVDTKTYQQFFNLDKLDGTGRSGILLNFATQNLFTIGYSWLGTNAIIYTVVIAGIKYPFHIENVGNSLPAAWCRSGQLPMYFENTNSGVTGSNTTFNLGCSAVFTFGSTAVFKRFASLSSGPSTIPITAAETVCAGIRLRPGLKYVTIEPSSYQITPATGTAFLYYKIIFRPTLVGALWSDYGSISQILTNTPTFSGGIILQEGHLNLTATARVAVDIPAQLETALGYSINGTPDSLILVARTTTGAGSFYFAGAWKEIY